MYLTAVVDGKSLADCIWSIYLLAKFFFLFLLCVADCPQLFLSKLPKSRTSPATLSAHVFSPLRCGHISSTLTAESCSRAYMLVSGTSEPCPRRCWGVHSQAFAEGTAQVSVATRPSPPNITKHRGTLLARKQAGQQSNKAEHQNLLFKGLRGCIPSYVS